VEALTQQADPIECLSAGTGVAFFCGKKVQIVIVLVYQIGSKSGKHYVEAKMTLSHKLIG
jgi:hypothetical protein